MEEKRSKGQKGQNRKGLLLNLNISFRKLMNIIILSDRYHPTPVSGAVLIYDLARELVEQNHNVYVLTADSNISTPYKLCVEEGVNILRVKTQNQKELSKPSRLLFELLLQP